MFSHNVRSIAFVSALCCALVSVSSDCLFAQEGAAGEVQGTPEGQPAGTESGVPQGDPQGSQETGDTAVATNAGKEIPPGSWFKTIHIDFGKHVESNKALRLKGEYKFTNESGAEQKITTVTSSCKCQELELYINGKKQSLEKKTTIVDQLKQPIMVPKGAEGVVKLVFDVSGSAGARSGHIRVDTTDAKMPTLNLTCAAVIDPAFVVEPLEIQLGEMAPTDSKKWSAKVRCMLGGEWKLHEQALQPIASGMHVDSVTRKKDKRGDFYEIAGRYGPGLEEGAIGGNLLFKTDRDDRNILISIRASVREKIKINRSFFSFNRFPRSEGAESTVFVWPTDLQNGSLEVDRVEIVRGTHKDGGIEFEIVAPKPLAEGQQAERVEVPGRQDGIRGDKLWRVVCRAKPGLELKGGRRLSVTAKIHFKGEGTVAKTIRFNGFPAN